MYCVASPITETDDIIHFNFFYRVRFDYFTSVYYYTLQNPSLLEVQKYKIAKLFFGTCSRTINYHARFFSSVDRRILILFFFIFTPLRIAFFRALKTTGFPYAFIYIHTYI